MTSLRRYRCGGCGRGIPRGHEFCGRCARAGGVTVHGAPIARVPVKPGQVHVCGARLRNGGTCHRSLVGHETCSNPGH